MEKFTLYDLLAIILPGALLTAGINVLLLQYGIVDKEVLSYLEKSQLFKLGLWICQSILLGGLIFKISDLLIRTTLYTKHLPVFQSIGYMFYKLKDIDVYHISFLKDLSVKWFGHNVFLLKNEAEALEEGTRTQYAKEVGLFFSRAYYELEYEGKLNLVMKFQSFYFFFRQTLTSVLLLMLPIYAVVMKYNHKVTPIVLTLIMALIIWVLTYLAKHFRNEMMKKLFITYNTHLSINNNK